ncbi:MAG: hypothetical protein PHG82_02165 [Candidatus Gracilibacteria bacterium]|nr:hypothetical protein [Candidatus Gracilibacteria bacterium]
MNTKARISEERRLNAYHDRMDSIRKGGEKIKLVENEITEEVNDILDIQQETKTLQEIPLFTGNLEALEISGLEPFDLGKPTCPEIILNKFGESSYTEPQAWEDGGNWYYNPLGALKELEFLGKKVPEDWERICEPYWNDGQKMVEELGLKLAGYRGEKSLEIIDKDRVGMYYSGDLSNSSSLSSFLSFDSQNIWTSNGTNTSYGFLIRCLKNAA